MKDIKGYEGLYAITSCGKVWSYRRKIFLKPSISQDGYWRVSLSKEGKVRTIEIHRLVAETYISNPNGLPQVNHIDENKAHNYINNLEWVDAKRNANHGNRNEKISKTSKGRSKKARAIYCVELDRIFRSQSEARCELGLPQAPLCWALQGKRNMCGGYHWKYVEEK